MKQYYNNLFCECGCGGRIEIQLHHKYSGVPRFVIGHSTRCMSEETKKKMSEARMGRKVTKETRKKISNSLKGRSFEDLHGEEKSKYLKNRIKIYQTNKIVSEETKRKMSESREGRIVLEKTKDKMRGKNNPNWRGGISFNEYCPIFSDEKFKHFIKERDGYKCLNPDCWGTSKRLSVHHIDYNKKECKLLNLITLCASCNSRANKDRKWHQGWYQAIMYMRYGGHYEK